MELSHIGLCVADLQRSLRFYCDGLGFQRGVGARHGPGVLDRLVGIEGADLENQFLVKGDVTIELLQFHAPGHVTAPTPRPMNQVGFTHLSMEVEDLAVACDQVQRHGGRVLDQTRHAGTNAEGLTNEAVMTVDPDGTRVELVCFAPSIRFRKGRFGPPSERPVRRGAQ